MRVIETSMDEDLAVLSAYLWSVGIRHRVFEERGRQVVEIGDPADADAVRAAHAASREGRLTVPDRAAGAQRQHGPGPAAQLYRHLRAYPVLSAAIALACVVFPTALAIADGRPGPLGLALLVVDPARMPAAASKLDMLLTVEVWRWLTPVFLHFSIVHLAFNCVILLELGRRIERGIGSAAFALLFGILGVAGNVAQYFVGGSILFGGLSGIGYGLLGFILVMVRLRPAQAHWRLPPGLAVGLLVFLVLFSTGVTEPFGLHVANAAHWAGFAAGMVAALFGARLAVER